MTDFEAACTEFRLFNITYSQDAIEALQQMDEVVSEVYSGVLLYGAPFSVLANLISAFILVKNELRNPFNIVLSIMCLMAAIPLTIKSSLIYRQIEMECNSETITFSFALHLLVDNHASPVCRATYIWLAIILTGSRLGSLRSRCSWEASYTVMLCGAVIFFILACAASIPMIMMVSIADIPVEEACENEYFKGNNVTVPYAIVQPSKSCLLYRLNQWVTGVFNTTLPSILLVVFTFLLIFELRRDRKWQLEVAGSSAKNLTIFMNNNSARIARMLIIVAIFTLLSELPDGLANLANSFFSVQFEIYYYDPFIFVFRTIQLLATSCNLIIYTTMSKNFRMVVLRIIFFWRKKKQTGTMNTRTISVVSVSPNVNLSLNK